MIEYFHSSIKTYKHSSNNTDCLSNLTAPATQALTHSIIQTITQALTHSIIQTITQALTHSKSFGDDGEDGATVLSTAFGSGVVANRLGLPVAFVGEAGGFDAVVDKVVVDGFGALFGEGLV